MSASEGIPAAIESSIVEVRDDVPFHEELNMAESTFNSEESDDESESAILSGLLLKGVEQFSESCEGCGDVSISSRTMKGLMQSVVRIHAIGRPVDFKSPWVVKDESTKKGSGFVILSFNGLVIITNAHVIKSAFIVKMEKPGSTELFDAEIVAVAHEPDLAVLAVHNKNFWKGLVPLYFSLNREGQPEIPHMLENVYVVGFPKGGKSLSITKGVVNRIEVGQYKHSGTSLLLIQIDAAINGGNSGGPVVTSSGKVVGVAFQGLRSAEAIGYVIPGPIVNHVLNDLKMHGNQYTGMVSLGITYQSLRNPALIEYFGLDKISEEFKYGDVKPDGVVVADVDTMRYGTNAKKNYGFRRGDVILAIDKKNVARDGSVKLRDYERVALSYLLINRYSGDFISATILRNNTILDIEVLLTPPNFVVPTHTNDVIPRYLIFGGLVFIPLTKQYLRDHKRTRGRIALSTIAGIYSSTFKTPELEEIVVLSRILSSKLTNGYKIENQCVESVNDISVKSLKHLREILYSTTALFTNIKFKGNNFFFVLNRTASVDFMDKILKFNKIEKTNNLDFRLVEENM